MCWLLRQYIREWRQPSHRNQLGSRTRHNDNISGASVLQIKDSCQLRVLVSHQTRMSLGWLLAGLKTLNHKPENERRKIPTSKSQKKNLGLRIGTWNVHTLRHADKLDDLIRTAKEYKVDVIALQEIRKDGKGNISVISCKTYRFRI